MEQTPAMPGQQWGDGCSGPNLVPWRPEPKQYRSEGSQGAAFERAASQQPLIRQAVNLRLAGNSIAQGAQRPLASRLQEVPPLRHAQRHRPLLIESLAETAPTQEITSRAPFSNRGIEGQNRVRFGLGINVRLVLMFIHQNGEHLIRRWLVSRRHM
jgi:hypothetical protein